MWQTFSQQTKPWYPYEEDSYEYRQCRRQRRSSTGASQRQKFRLWILLPRIYAQVSLGSTQGCLPRRCQTARLSRMRTRFHSKGSHGASLVDSFGIETFFVFALQQDFPSQGNAGRSQSLSRFQRTAAVSLSLLRAKVCDSQIESCSHAETRRCTRWKSCQCHGNRRRGVLNETAAAAAAAAATTSSSATSTATAIFFKRFLPFFLIISVVVPSNVSFWFYDNYYPVQFFPSFSPINMHHVYRLLQFSYITNLLVSCFGFILIHWFISSKNQTIKRYDKMIEWILDLFPPSVTFTIWR